MKKKLLLPLLSLFLVSCNSDLLDELINSETAVKEEKKETPTENTSKDDNEAKTISKFNIKFVNDDNSVLEQKTVEAGTVPSTNHTPEKESDEQYDYTFAGWDPEFYAADKDQTYKAKYNPILKSYHIYFYSNDGKTLLDDQTVYYGNKPKYRILSNNGSYAHVGYTETKGSNVATITRESDFSTVTADKYYYAVYQEKTYRLTFYLNETGSSGIIKSINVPMNTTPDLKDYPEIEPECKTYFKQSDFKNYEFQGWYGEGALTKDKMLGKVSIDTSKLGIKTVSKDTVYYPVFKETNLTNKYTSGYITYKPNTNSQLIKVIPWDTLISDGYISVNGKELIPNVTKLKTLNSIYFVINSSIESITAGGFQGLSQLRYAYTDNIKVLGNYCFRGCTDFYADYASTYPLPAAIEKIPQYLFENTNVHSFVYVGTSLKTIDTNAFNATGGNNDLQLRLLNMTSSNFNNNVTRNSKWYGNKKITVYFSDGSNVTYGS